MDFMANYNAGILYLYFLNLMGELVDLKLHKICG